MHVGTAQIQCPSDVVEGGNQHSVGVLLPQRFADSAQFRGRVLACVFQRMKFYGIFGNRRTVEPDEAQRVVVRAQGQTALFPQFLHQFLDESRRIGRAINRNLCELFIVN